MEMRTYWVLCFLYLPALMGVTLQENAGSSPRELNDFSHRIGRSSASVQNELAKSFANWKFQDGANQNAVHVDDHRRAKNAFEDSQRSSSSSTGQRKSDRKAEPDVQDIISGIVHLLGGKVNIQAASGVDQSANQKSSAIHSTRVNNRGPPLATEVPFEAIPLQLSNLGPPRAPGQQPPYGIPLRRPVWPPGVNNPGQNLQNLPFGSGVPLPVQLIPPQPPKLPLRPPVESVAIPVPPQLILQTNATESTTTQAEEVFSIPTTEDKSEEEQPPFEEDIPEHPGSSTSSFELEDGVSSVHWSLEPSSTADSTVSVTSNPETSTASTTETSEATTPTSSTLVRLTETSSLDAILRPSIEDVTTTPADVISPTPLEQAVSPIFTSRSPFIETFAGTSQPVQTQSYVPPRASVVPQIDGVHPYYQSVPSESYTPPLSRPGHVFHENYRAPQSNQPAGTLNYFIPQSSIGDTFELVLSASQNFGGDRANAPPPVAPGKPHVIPVDIEELRGGQETLVTSIASSSEQFVSIDGRRTYFNVHPTPTQTAARPTTQPPVVQTTASVQRIPLPQNSGTRNAPPAVTSSNPVRPPSPPSRPGSVAAVAKPTPALVRKPVTPSLSRIDACIVGDPSTCSDPNETCKTEDNVSACSCKGGYGRRRSSDPCKALVGIVMSLKLDRLNNQALEWSSAFTDPESHEYKQLLWESRQAMTSVFGLVPLSSVYVSSSVNKFYPVGNKVVINATVYMDQTPETLSVAIRSQLQKQLMAAIQQRNNNVGVSRLWADVNPIPLVQDLNECFSADLNDCHENAECFNTPGSFQCRCRPGYLDPFVNDPHKAGRRCESCSPDYCNNRGECSVENGKKVCECRGSYQGSQCEVDGEVLGVAIGASVAAVVIIILTLVFLCLWSRRWRKNQEKVERGLVNQMAQKTMLFPTLMQDRMRWAQLAEAMAAHNLYATVAQPPTGTNPQYQSRPTSAVARPISAVPPPVPPRLKKPLRPTGSLPVMLLTTPLTNPMLGVIQQLVQRFSRTHEPQNPDPINVNHNLALIGPSYPMGTLASMGRTLATPMANFHRPQSVAGSVRSFGKQRRAPPPPSHPPPSFPMETSEESAAESEATFRTSRPFHVPRPRSRASTTASSNIYYEADLPSMDFSQVSLNTYQHRQHPFRR